MELGARHRAWLVALLSATAVATLLACATPQQRYKVLSFFFDGVPPPESGAAAELRQAPTDEDAIALSAQAALASAIQPSIHKPYQKKECDRCHAGSTQTMRKGDKPFCFDCHKESDLGKKLNHDPAAEGECLECHHPHRSANPALLTSRTTELCFACHDPDDKPYKNRHKPLRQKGGCTNCHNPHGGTQTAFLRSEADTCTACHPLRSNPRSVHAPVESGDCQDCHLPHRSGEPHNLRAAAEDPICFECHEGGGLADELNHGPAADGECLECHEAHTSRHLSLLKKSPREMCFDCHEREDPVYLERHKLVRKEDSCTQCHNPHGGKTSAFVKSGPEGCLACHRPKADAQTVHAPVKEGDCQECHLGHGSGRPYNLKVEGDSPICFDCHDKDDLADEVNHYPAAADECLECHEPHRSKYPALLKKPGGGVCFGCHEPDEVGYLKFHKSLGKEGKCGKCHNPHGGKRKGFLKAGPNVCQVCHPPQSGAKTYHSEAPAGACEECHPGHGAGK